MAAFWHPPHPLVGRVMSMIQLGERSGMAEARKVFQSDLLRGEKIFVPAGQLFLSFER
jgi:nucleoside recognition membrane protein YjiH